MMKQVLLLLFIVLPNNYFCESNLNTDFDSVDDGTNMNIKPFSRIVNGVHSEHLPFYVFLSFPVSKNSDLFGFCGGSVISPSVVLTAAHCIMHKTGNFNPDNIVINYGNVARSQMKKMGAVGVVVHKDFHIKNHNGGEFLTNDVAVIILERPLTIHDKMKPITLGTAPAPGGQVWAAGYGSQQQRSAYASINGATAASYLLKVDLQIVSNDQCANMVSSPIEPNHICGIEKGRNVCQGDSGGPLYTKDAHGNSHVIGLGSMTYGCADDRMPAIFTRVSFFHDWIMDKVNNHQNYISDQLLQA